MFCWLCPYWRRFDARSLLGFLLNAIGFNPAKLALIQSKQGAALRMAYGAALWRCDCYVSVSTLCN